MILGTEGIPLEVNDALYGIPTPHPFCPECARKDVTIRALHDREEQARRIVEAMDHKPTGSFRTWGQT